MAAAAMGSNTKGPAKIGVHSLDHFAFTVPDLHEARTFYETFGLDVRAERDALGLYTYGSGHRWAIILLGARKALQYLCFGVTEAHLPLIEARLEDLGVKRLPPPDHAEEGGIWFTDTSGTALHIRIAEKSSPDEAAFVRSSQPAGSLRGSPSRSAAGPVHPTRLSHLQIYSRDVLKDVAFYEAALGLRLSDRSGDAVAFMHGQFGSDHHMFALAKSDRPGFHHSSWTVHSVDEVGRGAVQMQSGGYDQGWGLGRHVLGSNFFYYVQDPWHSYAEYSFGIDYVPGTLDWPSADHPAEDAFYIWGPNPPPDFGKNFE